MPLNSYQSSRVRMMRVIYIVYVTWFDTPCWFVMGFNAHSDNYNTSKSVQNDDYVDKVLQYVNISSVNHLVLSGIKTSPDLMLTTFHEVIWHHQELMHYMYMLAMGSMILIWCWLSYTSWFHFVDYTAPIISVTEILPWWILAYNHMKNTSNP